MLTPLPAIQSYNRCFWFKRFNCFEFHRQRLGYNFMLSAVYNVDMISVIVPVYNTAAYLERVIGALEAQDFPKDGYELIFVDNGSSDGSADILQRHPEIRVLQELERGSYSARNQGVKQARGEILAFSDSDCYPAPNWLEAIDKAFRDSEVQVLLGPRVPPAASRAMRLVAEYENKKVELVCASNDPLVYFGHTNNMAVRKTAMDRFGPFIQRARGSDTIFVRAVVDALSCKAAAYCPEMVVQHAELESLTVYYSKVRTYARSRQAYRHITQVRPLSQQERLRAFWEATKQRPFVDSVQLFALLVLGSFVWWHGGLNFSSSDS
jgi:glycosyltransferase involved in cell wall biosynthesis